MGVCICVFVCVLSRVQLFALEQWHMCVCVCVFIHVRLSALEQWQMAVYVCVRVCVLRHFQLFALSSGIWGCGCV